MLGRKSCPGAVRPALQRPACRLFAQLLPALRLQRTGNRGSATWLGRLRFGGYSGSSEFPFAGGHKSADSWIPLAGKIHGFGKRLEQCFNYVMGFSAIEQLQVKVAARV